MNAGRFVRGASVAYCGFGGVPLTLYAITLPPLVVVVVHPARSSATTSIAHPLGPQTFRPPIPEVLPWQEEYRSAACIACASCFLSDDRPNPLEAHSQSPSPSTTDRMIPLISIMGKRSTYRI